MTHKRSRKDKSKFGKGNKFDPLFLFLLYFFSSPILAKLGPNTSSVGYFKNNSITKFQTQVTYNSILY
jgi:hypothetical protein